MVVSYLQDLTWISLLLIVGLIISFISLKLKIPQIFLLIITGALFSSFISLPASFLAGLSIFALILIVFDSVSKIKASEILNISPKAIKLTLLFLIANLIFLSLFTNFLFFEGINTNSIIMCLIFAALMSGTDPATTLTIFKDQKSKLIEILKIESIVNTPLNVIIPLILINVYQGIFEAQIVLKTFLQSIMTGVGSGVVIGLIIFGLMRKKYSENLSPIVILASALISYSLAENLGGNGILSVTSLAVVYSISTLKEKTNLGKFTSVFAMLLRIIVFILLGLVIRIPLETNFIFKTIVLFLIYLIIRFIVVKISFRELPFKNIMFMSLNAPKGVATAVVIFILSGLDIQGISTIINLSFAFVIYSVFLETFTARFSTKLIKNDKS